MTNPSSTLSWPTYIDFDEAWQGMQMDQPPTDAERVRLQRFIDSACTTAQRGAQQPFGPMAFRYRFDGWQGFEGAHIILPYAPVLDPKTTMTVTEWWGFSGPHTLIYQDPEDQGVGDCFQVSPLEGRVTRTFMGLIPRPFFPGSRNIEITWTAGFNPLPPDIWDATMDLIEYKWRMRQESPRWFRSTGSDFGGDASNPLYPGVPNRIAEIFEGYRNMNTSIG